MKHTTYSYLMILALVLTACTDYLEGDGHADPTKGIVFSTSLEDLDNAPMSRAVGGYTIMEMTDWVDSAKATTRSTPTTALSGNASVYGYQYDDAFPSEVSKDDRILTNAEFTFKDGMLEPVGDLTYWSGIDKDKAFFCSYAPYGASGISPTVYSGKPGVTYTVPTAVKDQTDVLYASKEVAGTYKQAIPFEYKHALTAIQFKMGFACTVKSISIQNVNTQGTFTFDKAASGNVWETSSNTESYNSYTISFGDGVAKAEGDMLTDGENTLMLIPQSFGASSTAKVVLVYNDGSEDKTISASLANSTWGMGKKIVYTLYNTTQTMEAVFFDLAAGNVKIDASTYTGYIYVNGAVTEVSDTHNANNKYYVYQSTGATAGDNSGANTGYASSSAMSAENCRIPNYKEFSISGKSWGDYITNNSDVDDVINAWNNNINKSTSRISVANQISVSGQSTFDVIIDNIYTTYTNGTSTGPIDFRPTSEGTMNLKLKGDNRLNNIYYLSCDSITKGTKRGFLHITSYEGDGAKTGTLTVGSFTTGTVSSDCVALIGPNSSVAEYGLSFNGGTVFAGTSPQKYNIWNNRSSDGMLFPCNVGGGANAKGEVTITGGRLTAVSNGTSAAIGGGGGYECSNGYGYVYIRGGETYAYGNGIYSTYTADKRVGYVPTTAIGGPSTFRESQKNNSIVEISGGYVYAQSLGGTAIGGGSSRLGNGSSADITISETANVVAVSASGTIRKSRTDASQTMAVSAGTAIGGGNSYANKDTKDNKGKLAAIGGAAVVNITGGTLTTGSVGGGKGANSLGTAQITISGDPVISGQFIMSAGASTTPSFTMTGGTIQNSSTSDNTYKKVQENGGAVYIEDGQCTISGGTINGCSAEKGGAVYVTGGRFTLSGGTLSNNHSSSDGGAVYVSGGNVAVAGGSITHNYTVNGNGGGVHVTGGGTFNMPTGGSGGKITYNSANSTTNSTTGNGGGVYVASKAGIGANILSGTVSNNTADHNGGGMYVEIGGTASTSVTIGVENQGSANPDISNNSAGYSGGALCVIGKNSKVTIKSGKVRGNTSAYQKNQDIRNDGGLVELTSDDCDIDYKTITFHSNDGNNKTAVQRIVTNTNSVLAVPTDATAWTSEFGSISGWNTSKYGTGTTYTNGQTMNISNNMDLYAVWTENSAKRSSKFHK